MNTLSPADQLKIPPGGSRPELLLNRLDAIGRSLAATGHAVALIGLGSVGRELDRLDAYSDLDFFAIVDEGHKPAYIDDLSWLSSVAPVAFAFRNSADGYKLLYADGVFCEFAVFTPSELAGAAFSPGRLVWHRPDFDPALATPPTADRPPREPDVPHLLGEALTNLYVGLGRYRRGEKLSAMRFVQGYAVDRVIELARLMEQPTGAAADVFDGPRRFERRFPTLAQALPDMLQGYERTPESAEAILTLLDEHFSVDPALKTAIEALLRA